jgi:hypothetical protein
MAIGTFVLAAAVTFFVLSFRQFKVQTKIVETNVEGVLGLELLRQDLDSLGFGLPWNNLVAYDDVRAGVNAAVNALNDSPNPPRAVVSIDNPSFTFNNSDYLVLKSAKVGMDDAAGKWTTLTQTGVPKSWVPNEENVTNGDYVIVLRVGSTDADRRSLVTSGGTAYTAYNNVNMAGFAPVEPYSANIVYGIGRTAPHRPFNRAEYFIDNSAVPRHCAPNTGVLVKAVVRQDANGTTDTLLPLLDCVADFQVIYLLDTNGDGNSEPPPVDDIRTALPTAADVRTQVAEVRVHILAQEGQRDDSYQSPASLPWPGFPGRNFDVGGYRNYRWKVYSIAIKPRNLAQR